MEVRELEARLETLERLLKTSQDKVDKLETKLNTQENELRTFRDIEEIKRLQRCYGYYLEHGMMQEVQDLFADDPDVATHWLGKGSYIGVERAKEAWGKAFPPEMVQSKEFLHLIMQLSPIIDIAPDGKAAKGRWYCWAAVAIPMDGKILHEFATGSYENEYIKENGRWKFKTINCRMIYIIRNPKEGFVNPERFMDFNSNPAIYQEGEPDFDNPEKYDRWQYPSAYILPFHFKHPVTGKETSDKARNASLDGASSV